MSHLTCQCGHAIQDHTDDIPYKGYVVRDQEKYVADANIAKLVTSFMEAISRGQRGEWLDGFLRPGYDPASWDNESVVWAILSSQFVNRHLDIYQCERCGRLHLQVPGTQRFRSFLPDDDWKDALKVNVQTPNNEPPQSPATRDHLR